MECLSKCHCLNGFKWQFLHKGIWKVTVGFIMKFNEEIFRDDDKLRVYTKEEWKSELITLEVVDHLGDDLPF